MKPGIQRRRVLALPMEAGDLHRPGGVAVAVLIGVESQLVVMVPRLSDVLPDKCFCRNVLGVFRPSIMGLLATRFDAFSSAITSDSGAISSMDWPLTRIRRPVRAGLPLSRGGRIDSRAPAPVKYVRKGSGRPSQHDPRLLLLTGLPNRLRGNRATRLGGIDPNP
jgi:hypothetical protein